MKKVTPSGLLNFIDGIWSNSGKEMIIIFTTNFREKLDPALRRLGCMDVNINMGYFVPAGFRVLVSSYLGIEDHGLFGKIETKFIELLFKVLWNFLVQRKKNEVDEARAIIVSHRLLCIAYASSNSFHISHSLNSQLSTRKLIFDALTGSS
ncbi:hypothetical protein CMV_005724 [Castanea mollissima]|uniref:ATPase AAA-type core domain-containing protein n=1 Tax=Castanea mollissima TaxID=60419 RepID=A0A8J4RS78_9ROSI|nr:hypothetical protein CMV_005724 [Castanea mollissima]